MEKGNSDNSDEIYDDDFDAAHCNMNSSPAKREVARLSPIDIGQAPVEADFSKIVYNCYSFNSIVGGLSKSDFDANLCSPIKSKPTEAPEISGNVLKPLRTALSRTSSISRNNSVNEKAERPIGSRPRTTNSVISPDFISTNFKWAQMNEKPTELCLVCPRSSATSECPICSGAKMTKTGKIISLGTNGGDSSMRQSMSLATTAKHFDEADFANSRRGGRPNDEPQADDASSIVSSGNNSSNKKNESTWKVNKRPSISQKSLLRQSLNSSNGNITTLRALEDEGESSSPVHKKPSRLPLLIVCKHPSQAVN